MRNLTFDNDKMMLQMQEMLEMLEKCIRISHQSTSLHFAQDHWR